MSLEVRIISMQVCKIAPLHYSRFVFWIDCCEHPHIGRVGMDGSQRATIVDVEIYSPAALTIDYTNRRLYWADENHILFANMDGSRRHKGK